VREIKGYGSIFSLKIEGNDDLIADIARMGMIALIGARNALTEKAQEIKRKAIPMTPDDPETPGLLRKTVRVYAQRTKSLKPGSPIYAGVVAGGKRLEKRMGKRKYNASALVQHEDLTLKHTSGGPKYLERPGNQVAPTIPQHVLDCIDMAAENASAEYAG
jgi:hypothetical protein